MNDNREDSSAATRSHERIDSFQSHGDSLVIYDREVIDAWIKADFWVCPPDAADESA